MTDLIVAHDDGEWVVEATSDGIDYDRLQSYDSKDARCSWSSSNGKEG